MGSGASIVWRHWAIVGEKAKQLGILSRGVGVHVHMVGGNTLKVTDLLTATLLMMVKGYVRERENLIGKEAPSYLIQ